MDNRQLLIDFFMFFRNNGENYIGLSIEKFVDKFIEENNLKFETYLIDYDDTYCNYELTECCGIGPIINEKYCPNCGKKIIKIE